jgi:hypothetical protein
MPNWCEGSLKVRGKKSDITRWVRENVVAYTHEWVHKENEIPYMNSIPNPKAVTVEYDEPESDEICITVKTDAHITGTRRNFVKVDEYWAYDHNGTMILVLNFMAAWGIEPEPYVAMSQKYHVDFRLYGFERGMEFNQEVIVEDGQLIRNVEITFDDYEWECIFSNLGG